MSRTFRRGRLCAYRPSYYVPGVGLVAPDPKPNSLPLSRRFKCYRDSDKHRPWKCTCERCGCGLTHRHERAKLVITPLDHELLTDHMLNRFKDAAPHIPWCDWGY